MQTKAYIAHDQKSPLVPGLIQRREPGPQDIQIEILYCGICHSDLHAARNEWEEGGFPMVFPVVPGHEIVGRATKVGRNVRKFKEGDLVAVGCLVDSDGTCIECREGLEQFCPNLVFTYGGDDKHLGGKTFGGYSESIVVDERFVLTVPKGQNLAAVAPLLCAGITTYSPMRTWNVRDGKKVGIVGLGGLGHMAVKFARAFGAHVVLFTTSAHKTEDALRLGAHEVVLSKNPNDMLKHADSFDFILDAVSAPHDMNAYLELLKRDGTLTLVGAPEKPLQIKAFNLLFKRRRLAGSPIGSLQQTQEMLDFCAEKGIASDIEMIPIQKVNEAYERLMRSDVKYRFVIDIESLKNEPISA
jgi:uncharacterized zinc-type alcohol dehydrogenase-like protein